VQLAVVLTSSAQKLDEQRLRLGELAVVVKAYRCGVETHQVLLVPVGLWLWRSHKGEGWLRTNHSRQ
jgi:hypothetical protein